MTNHVPTIETCQKMKEAGFPQDTEHSYFLSRHDDAVFIADSDEFAGLERVPDIVCAAPLLTEVLGQLPKHLELKGDKYELVANFHDDYSHFGFWFDTRDWGTEFGPSVEHTNPAEAAALLYLSLKGDNAV